MFLDIKGANVLVDNNGICKLADFGSAKKLCGLYESERYHSLSGTANWMAPEVIKQTGSSRQLINYFYLFLNIWIL
jgi:serine/threonine protein kinase